MGVVASTIDQIDDSLKDELIANSSNFECQYMIKLIRNIQHSIIVIHASTYGDLSKNYRDMYMAENALWLSNLFGEDKKIALWAHNLHIANYSVWRSMGYELKMEIDDLYKTVGFSFSNGQFTAVARTKDGVPMELQTFTINSTPMDSSINHIFYQAKYDNFIFNTSDILADSELGKWISTARPMLTIGARYDGDSSDDYPLVLLQEYYDVIINYDNTTASEIL